MRVFTKIFCCTWTVSCQKFVHYIRMLCTGCFILNGIVCTKWIYSCGVNCTSMPWERGLCTIHECPVFYKCFSNNRKDLDNASCRLRDLQNEKKSLQNEKLLIEENELKAPTRLFLLQRSDQIGLDGMQTLRWVKYKYKAFHGNFWPREYKRKRYWDMIRFCYSWFFSGSGFRVKNGI